MTTTYVPLPSKRSDGSTGVRLSPASSGNQGLYYAKFFNQWESSFAETIKAASRKENNKVTSYHTGKMSWILSHVTRAWKHNSQFKISDQITANLVGNQEALALATSKIANIATSRSAHVTKTLTTNSPFVTGMGLEHPVENGFLWHHTLSVPYLPGSSIKGLIRNWVAYWCSREREDKDYDAHIDEIWRLFGGPVYREEKTKGKGEVRKVEIRPKQAGNIIVFDALPTKPVELMPEVITPHDGGWRIKEPLLANAPADWISPIPIPILAIAPGTSFQFCLALRPGARIEDLNNAFSYLTSALEWTGIGAKTAIGFGRFFDQETEEQRKIAKFAAWIPKAGQIASIEDDFDEEIIVEICSNNEDNEIWVSEIGSTKIYPVDKIDLTFIADSIEDYRKENQ
ncbi:type III-B CRISPR module RAMP protein Cmr6 [uncultured Cohaesibacter sp.]|uniref:type III-B CRISPR module RAMP protein Cmr6 n=1 Tax=uncultured Cohaesibacter sp. TaxID=1002546 RepID=UPI002AA86F72|nr:type III-B CRISPR module RAMP protein Cmr6 [uncultured Cohaesibacter sp.]